jgi:hypothetical protein
MERDVCTQHAARQDDARAGKRNQGRGRGRGIGRSPVCVGLVCTNKQASAGGQEKGNDRNDWMRVKENEGRRGEL